MNGEIIIYIYAMNDQAAENSNKSSTTIKNWAPDDRPREKLLTKGKESLSDSELLAILLQTGSGNKTAVDLAKEILHGCNNNLGELSKQSLASLTRVKGVGNAKAITIVAAMELGRRRQAISHTQQTGITQSSDVPKYLHNILRDHQKEVFLVVFLNARNKVLHQEVISTGGITGTLVDPRLIFQRALELKSVRIILCHNHPSGNLNPSRQDEFITEKMVNAGKLLDIEVADHIIVGEEGYYSFADNGKL